MLEDSGRPVIASFTLGDSDSDVDEDEELFHDTKDILARAAEQVPSGGIADPTGSTGGTTGAAGDRAGSAHQQQQQQVNNSSGSRDGDSTGDQQQPPASATPGQPQPGGGKADPLKAMDLEGLLENFHKVYDPDNMHQVRAIMEKYAGREAHIYEDELRERYLGDKPDFWGLIRKVYAEKNESKLPEVQSLLMKYAGKEPNLYLQICAKYQVEPDKAVEAPTTASGAGAPSPSAPAPASAATPPPAAGPVGAAGASEAAAAATAFAPPPRLGLFSRLRAKRDTQPSVEALKEHLQEAIERDATSQQEVGQLRAELIDRDASMANYNEEVRSLVAQVERFQLVLESGAEGGGGGVQELEGFGEEGAGLREEACELRAQRLVHEEALQEARDEISSLAADATQRQRANEAFHGQEVYQLEQQVAVLRRSSEQQEEQAANVAGRAGDDAVARLMEVRRQLEAEQQERDLELRAATEEIRNLATEAEQWQVLQREEAVSAEEAHHAAESHHVELLDAQSLLADTQRSCSALSSGALEERDAALRSLEELRAEHDAKDVQLQSLTQELRERERSAEDGVEDARVTESCLEAARERISELEAQLGAAARETETSAVMNIGGMVASAVRATAEEEVSPFEASSPAEPPEQGAPAQPPEEEVSPLEGSPPAEPPEPTATAPDRGGSPVQPTEDQPPNLDDLLRSDDSDGSGLLETAAAAEPPPEEKREPPELIEEPEEELVELLEPLGGEPLPLSIPPIDDDDIL